MQLAARTGAWSGKALPYDAEVEWLEEGPTGSFIQTDIPTTKNTSCSVSLEVVNATKMDNGGVCCAIYGLGLSWDFYSYGLFYLTKVGQHQRGKVNFHGHNNVLSDVLQTDGPVRFDVSISANGSDNVIVSCGSFSSSASIKNIKDSGRFVLLWPRLTWFSKRGKTAMCMMKNSGEKEACEVANNLAALENSLKGATLTNIVRTIGTNKRSDQ